MAYISSLHFLYLINCHVVHPYQTMLSIINVNVIKDVYTAAVVFLKTFLKDSVSHLELTVMKSSKSSLQKLRKTGLYFPPCSHHGIYSAHKALE